MIRVAEETETSLGSSLSWILQNEDWWDEEDLAVSFIFDGLLNVSRELPESSALKKLINKRVEAIAKGVSSRSSSSSPEFSRDVWSGILQFGSYWLIKGIAKKVELEKDDLLEIISRNKFLIAPDKKTWRRSNSNWSEFIDLLLHEGLPEKVLLNEMKSLPTYYLPRLELNENNAELLANDKNPFFYHPPHRYNYFLTKFPEKFDKNFYVEYVSTYVPSQVSGIPREILEILGNLRGVAAGLLSPKALRLVSLAMLESICIINPQSEMVGVLMKLAPQKGSFYLALRRIENNEDYLETLRLLLDAGDYEYAGRLRNQIFRERVLETSMTRTPGFNFSLDSKTMIGVVKMLSECRMTAS